MIRVLVPALALSFALAGAASAQAAAAGLREACANDIQTLCAGVQPGGGRIMACLKEHPDKVSAGCKSAIMAAMAERKANAAAAPAPAAQPQPH